MNLMILSIGIVLIMICIVDALEGNVNRNFYKLRLMGWCFIYRIFVCVLGCQQNDYGFSSSSP